MFSHSMETIIKQAQTVQRQAPKYNPIDEELEQLIAKQRARIKVVGAGGAGNNTINRITEVGIVGAETIAINTDAQDLLYTNADAKILIGKELTQGLGAGSLPEVGEQAARETEHEIKSKIQGSDMVFLTCGLGGGCLRASSLVHTNPKGPVRIDTMKAGDKVYTYEDGKLIKKKVLAAMKTGIKRVLELKTRNRTIYATFDHPFLKVKPHELRSNDRFSKFDVEWTELQNLKIGDLIVVLRELSQDDEKPFVLPNGKQTDTRFAQLFGFLLGDGWITGSGGSWKLCVSPSEDEATNKKYFGLIKEIFNLEMKKGDTWFYANSKAVYELLDALGLHKRAHLKEVPQWVFGLPRDQKKAFIIGLADADGNYATQFGRTGLPKREIKFEMSSEVLIKQLKMLCDSIGLRTSNVSTRTRIIKAPNSKEAKPHTSWTIRIYKTHELLGELPHPKARHGVSFLYKFRSRQLPEFFENFGFNRVTSIKEIGKEEVFDITVEGSHNFISEGFVVHNTGTGSLPVVADVAKKLGALTIAVVTLPFEMEGSRRYENAMRGLEKLENTVDTLIVIPNDKLLELAPDLPLHTAFKVADEILTNSVKGIAELITKAGLVNLDFADVRTVMTNGGVSMIGVGESDSENRAVESVTKALNNPLLDVDISGGNGALINVSGGPDMTLEEAKTVVETVSKKLRDDARIIWGAQISEDLANTIRTMVIITGVSSPQIFGPRKTSGDKAKKDIEDEFGIDFIN